jgi:N-acetyl-anhydromuramyl-L-alanine amidase AmpD
MIYSLLLAFTLFTNDNIKIPKIIRRSLPAHDMRDTTHNYIILHYDSGGSINSVIRYLRRKHNSYHYLIDRTGKIYNFVNPIMKANHAGVSETDSFAMFNWYSIGICFHNTPPQEYTEAQYNSAAWLIGILQKRWPDITTQRILGHENVAWPRGRKHDPGQQFNWIKLFTLLQLNTK